MRCEQARRFMSLELDKLLSPEHKESLERHLRECIGCHTEWKLLLTVQKVLVTEKPAPMPYDLTSVIMERVKATERKTGKKSLIWLPNWRWLVFIGTPLTLALLTFFVLNRQAPSSPSEALYVSAHVTNAVAVSASPELMPVSIALSSVYFAGEE